VLSESPKVKRQDMSPVVWRCRYGGRYGGRQATEDTGSTVTVLRSSARRHGEISVERIETTPMTPEQYRRAVSALATLINQWKNHEENRPESGEKAA
jgi:hypothetical protein